MLNIEIVKFDVENEEPVRDENGFCIPCEDGEVGEAIGEIQIDAAGFDGYVDKQATQKKILSDVFEKDDKWFRSGDLLSRDKNGYFYFIDRIGDTFRWKGENVATSEVSHAFQGFNNIEEVNVYGVDLPGNDGKAGMVALVANKEDLERKILQVAYNKKELTYLECKYQFISEVLEDKKYLNDNILGKFYDRDFR